MNIRETDLTLFVVRLTETTRFVALRPTKEIDNMTDLFRGDIAMFLRTGQAASRGVANLPNQWAKTAQKLGNSS
jgi:hypothetical protein